MCSQWWLYQGNIIDDEELIRTLANSKTMSGIITERVKESEKTAIEIAEMRNQCDAGGA